MSAENIFTARYVVCGQVEIVFGMGMSVMNNTICCSTDSESPTTRGIESDDKASSSVLGVAFGGNRRKNVQFGPIPD